MVSRHTFISCSKLTCYWIPWCKPRKGFLPLLTSGIYRHPAVCLQDLFWRHQEELSDVHLENTFERVCCWSRDMEGGKLRDKRSSRERYPQQTSGGMLQWTSNPLEMSITREKPQHKSGLLTWRRTCEAMSEFSVGTSAVVVKEVERLRIVVIINLISQALKEEWWNGGYVIHERM